MAQALNGISAEKNRPLQWQNVIGGGGLFHSRGITRPFYL